ncbi:MAG: virulence protein SciE type [Acidobacteria bacterium]|nr:virulence protein SciE type [Acidobacteriota bacterium]
MEVMEAERLWKEGRLADATASAARELRDDPTDVRLRTLYFELLCFRGDWPRARKQLEVLGSDPTLQQSSLYYQRIIDAETQRQEMFQSPELGRAWLQPAQACAGDIDGARFDSIADADPRLGPRLELLTAGGYLLMPFAEISELTFEPPRRLRDLIWRKAHMKSSPARGGLDVGEVLVPALAPLSFLHESEPVQLGRVTVFEQDSQAGQKTLLAGDSEVAILSIHSLRFSC